MQPLAGPSEPRLKRALTRVTQALPRGHTLSQDAWQRRHGVLLIVLWGQAACLPAYALLQGHSLWRGLLSAAPVAAFAVAGGLARGRKIPSVLVALGLLTVSAMVVQLSAGAIDSHFHFFLTLVLLTIYEDWLPLLVGVGFVLLHHGVLGALAPDAVYGKSAEAGESWRWAAIHAAFAAMAGLAAVVVWRLNEDVRHRLHALVDSSGEAVIELDEEGRVAGWNPAAHATFGYSWDEVEGRPVQELAAPELRSEADGLVTAVLGGEFTQTQETVWQRADGRPVELALTLSPITHAGAVIGASIVARDMSERRALQEAEVRYRNLVERVPAVTYVAEAGADGRWHYVSPQIEKLVGYTPREWQANPELWCDRLHPDDRERVLGEEERFATTREPLAIEYRLMARDGSTVWVRDDAVFRPLGSPNERLMDGVFTDITENKRLEAQLMHLATHDQMTSIFNRHRFEEELRNQVSYSRRYGTGGALLVLDLDELKAVNDTYGHHAGDLLLKAVVGALSARLRENDVLARLGGDEFAVFLPGIGAEGARRVAEELLERVRRERVPAGGQKVGTTASLGVAMLDSDPTLDADRLLMQADTAMYEVKYAGGDAVAFFSPGAKTAQVTSH
jgi:diguanylate cyclase (GGDEF)-like protein/PAS domain S-box-containing protein